MMGAWLAVQPARSDGAGRNFLLSDCDLAFLTLHGNGAWLKMNDGDDVWVRMTIIDCMTS